MTRVIALGECMVEFHHIAGNTYQSGFSGDVLNSCVYMKRALTLGGGQQQTDILFMTAVGEDHFSDDMLKSWQEDDIDQTLVFRCKDKTPGLYIIRTDKSGERYFTYWRQSSAARQTLKCLKQAGGIDRLPDVDFFYFSGISMAILDEGDRQYLLEIICHLRKTGTKIAFDPNYRPLLWRNADEAAYWISQCYQQCDIALPGLEDEKALYSAASVEDVMARLINNDIAEIIVKAGTEGMFGQGPDGAFHVPFKAVDHCIDTTAAGDSFAGMYLAQRIMGNTQKTATIKAAKTAAFVVGYAGAITPYTDFKAFMASIA